MRHDEKAKEPGKAKYGDTQPEIRYRNAPSGSQAMRTKQGELLLRAFLASTGVHLSADIHSTSATSCPGYSDADNKSSNHSNSKQNTSCRTLFSFYTFSPPPSPHAQANSPSKPAPVAHAQSPRGQASLSTLRMRGRTKRSHALARHE